MVNYQIDSVILSYFWLVGAIIKHIDNSYEGKTHKCLSEKAKIKSSLFFSTLPIF